MNRILKCYIKANRTKNYYSSTVLQICQISCAKSLCIMCYVLVSAFIQFIFFKSAISFCNRTSAQMLVRLYVVISFCRCVSEFVEYKKRMKFGLSADGGDGVSPSTNAEAAYRLFGERTRVTWLKLMGHEDQLSRKITVGIYNK